MIDENAFGVLVAHYDLESIEYSLGEDAFLEYLARFSGIVDARLTEQPLGDSQRRIDLGHAVYLEFADGDQQSDPIVWLRGIRQALVEADLPNVCVFTAGGRWVLATDDDAPSGREIPATEASEPKRESGAWRVSSASDPDNSNPQASPRPLVDDRNPVRAAKAYGPSEALRKALAAEAFAQPTTSGSSDPSWGPGLYVEKDAIEQLGKSLKNAPTALSVLSATFYRIGA